MASPSVHRRGAGGVASEGNVGEDVHWTHVNSDMGHGRHGGEVKKSMVVYLNRSTSQGISPWSKVYSEPMGVHLNRETPDGPWLGRPVYFPSGGRPGRFSLCGNTRGHAAFLTWGIVDTMLVMISPKLTKVNLVSLGGNSRATADEVEDTREIFEGYPTGT